MRVLLLDHDGVICLSNNWGSRYKKQQRAKRKMTQGILTLPVDARFDNFDKKSIKILNEILENTGAEIVISSDWRSWATIEEMGDYYEIQGIIKRPIGFTKFLGECEYNDDFPWLREWDLQQTRSIEIKQYLKEHPEITHWVAIDDLNMGNKVIHFGVECDRGWGLENFVLTPLRNEGIKQLGIKEKILSFLK
jgi:hypothetical protein